MIYDGFRGYWKNRNTDTFNDFSDRLKSWKTLPRYAGNGYKVFLNISYFGRTDGVFYISKGETDSQDISVRESDQTLQTNHKEKTAQLGWIYTIVTKAIYVLRYGAKAKINYDSDLANNNSNYKYMRGGATRFLWMGIEEWQGFHRGVDFDFGYGNPVHSLNTGTISKIYFVGNNHFGVTIKDTASGSFFTCFHLQVDNDIVSGNRKSIKVGEQIGIQARNQFNGETEPQRKEKGLSPYWSHTHIEVNSGIQTYFNMAWTRLNYNNPPFNSDTEYFGTTAPSHKNYRNIDGGYAINALFRRFEGENDHSVYFERSANINISQYISSDPYRAFNNSISSIYK